MSPNLRVVALTMFVPVMCGTVFVHRAAMQSLLTLEFQTFEDVPVLAA